jgi:hypothetical protein
MPPCPRCRRPLSPGARFCAHCGLAVPLPAAAAAPRPTPVGAAWTLPILLILGLVVACGYLYQRAQERYDQRIAAGERPDPGDSLVGSGPFREVVTNQEQPEIRVADRTGDPEPSYLIFQGPGGTHTMTLRPPTTSLLLAPGTYRYELRGPQYRRSQQADQRGNLTCRRFRRYDLDLVVAPLGSFPRNQNLGDE